MSNIKVNQESLSISDLITVITKNDLRVISVYNRFYKDFDKYKDSRSLLLINLHELNLNTLLMYCNYAENYNNIHDKSWWIKRIPHQKEVVDKADNFEKFADDRDYNALNHIKDNYVLNIYFEFENKIRNIVREIGCVPNIYNKKKANQPYLIGDEQWQFIYKGFFDIYLSLKKDSIEVIELYSAIRNTIHNGGFYYYSKGTGMQINFMNKAYTFENLKPINFLTIDMINDIYDA